MHRLVALTLVLAASANVDANAGDRALKAMDGSLNRAKDQVLQFELVIQDAGRPRRIGVLVHTRGEQRRFEFLYPGDVKDMRMLSISRTQMYVWLPAYRKIRRIATHVRDQSMFGADYNYDDMSTTHYSGVYAGRLVSRSATQLVVEGTLRKGQASPYARVLFTLRKRDHMPEKLEYFNAKGVKVKTETRTKYTCQNGICGAALMKMVDHTRGDHWTECVRQRWTVDSGFSDDIFSLRRLQGR